MDQMHLEETVHYLAMESGSWTGDENTMVQAGTNEIEGDMYSARTLFDLGCAAQMISDFVRADRRLTGQQFQIIQFKQGFPGGELPVVLTQVMSSYGTDFVK